ncbi:putative transcription factor WD40-like family [Lupinus albus]|uniref:Putative transcription factor WD40-like family n=1 Tax=Lupinus albus TaxID=3870 RepID=A0A6A4QMR5_LUPAL|nr:putative transcription factor WD40-like family [Lupinus albus]
MSDSSITIAKFISNNPSELNSNEEYYRQLIKNHPMLIPVETIQKEGISPSSAKFTGFSKVQNLYITGHSNGAINFWDASCPFFTPILQLRQQSENDFSLSGIHLTALYFDCNSPLLVSGDQSGTVRMFRFKPEPYATNSFMSLTGGTKKGNDHIIHNMKLVKTNGAILCMNINHCSTHLAVGSDQGHVSVFNIDGLTLIYQKHIPSEISAGIISLQFQICKLHGFEKNILAVGTKDSSFLALDSETGNTLSSRTVHPNKPSKALFMQLFVCKINTMLILCRINSSILFLIDQRKLSKSVKIIILWYTDGQGESITKDGIDLREGNHNEDSTTKQMYILLCSEKALYVFSLVHAVQGIKKVLHKKFHSSSCCWALIFYGPSDIGLVLLFTNGQVELRTLPELSLIVETSIRGFTYSLPTLKSFSDIHICCSSKGDIVLVNGDQEIFIISLLVQRNIFRLLDSASCIYKKEKMMSEEEIASDSVVRKENKKGIFSSIIKDFTSSKEKHVSLMEPGDSKECIEELSLIFSNENFPCDADNNDNLIVDEKELELNIDDIDLDDDEGKHKEHSITGCLCNKKLAGKF